MKVTQHARPGRARVLLSGPVRLALAFLLLSPMLLGPTSLLGGLATAAAADLVLYEDSLQNGFELNSWHDPLPDPTHTSTVYQGTYALQKNLYISEGSGEFMAIQRAAGFAVSDFTHIAFAARSLSPEGAQIRVRLATQPWAGTSSEVALTVPADRWVQYQIPFSDFTPSLTASSYLGVAFSGGGPGALANDTDNNVVFDNVKLVDLSSSGGETPPPPAPPTPTATAGATATATATPPPSSGGPAPSAVTGSEDVRLQVDASRSVYPFGDNMRGLAMNNWNWLWGGIMDSNSAKRKALIDATAQLEPGVIRFAGGLWVNGTGWDRSNTAPADGSWSRDGRNYRHAYKPGMIDSYAAFARELGAETIMQVNICDNNPQMWADLVRYANIEKNHDFKYWELGNELDLDGCVGEGEYANRFASYREAMLAVDPAIKFLGPVPTMPYKTSWYDALVNRVGSDLDVLTWHWYQLTEWTSDRGAFAYQGGSVEALLNYNTGVGSACHDGFGCPGDTISMSRLNRMTYRRGLPDAMGQEVIRPFRRNDSSLETAITEIGTHASLHEHPINGNHIAALWLADTMGRWAYNGLDIMTYYSLEDGGTGAGNTRGLVGINNDSRLDVRPTYYTEFMYAQYFGDMMVQSSTSDPRQNVVVWASTDSDDPNTVKLMLVNFNDRATSAAIDVAGFTPTSGEAYEMTSRNAMSLANPDSFANHTTTINGVQIPDYEVSNASSFRNAIGSIKPKAVGASGSFTYTLPAYSVVALTLRGSGGGTPPPPAPPTPTATPSPTATLAPTATPSPAPTATPSPAPTATPSPTATPAPNQPPTANAGPDQTVTVNAPVSFSGAGSSDPDGTIASYQWTMGDGTTLNGASVTHQYANPGSYTVTLTVADDKGATGTDQATATVYASVALPLRINAGGPAVTDAVGNSWQADQAYDALTGWGYVDADNNTGRVDRRASNASFAVADAIDQGVMTTERWAMDSYRVNLPNGTYDLRLHFAETYDRISAAGQRVFNVAVEDTAAVSALDVYAEVGFARSSVKDVYGVQVQDGVLEVQFASMTQNPIINGIEVLAAAPEGTVRIDSSLTVGQHDDGRVGLFVNLDKATDANTGAERADVSVTGYKAELSYDPSLMDIVEVRPLSPLADQTFVVDRERGVVSFAGTDGTGASGPFTVAFVEVKLIGPASAQADVRLAFNEVNDAAGTRIAPVHHAGAPLSLAFQRGDVIPDGTVDILDATAGLQFLEGVRAAGDGAGEINLINFALVVADGLPTTKDVLALLEYLVGNRTDTFDPLPVESTTV